MTTTQEGVSMTVQQQEATPAGALAIRPDQTQLDEFQRAALQQMWGDDQPRNGDLAVFLHYAQRTGLDPFARQLYLILRDGKWGIQTGIDGLRIVAQRSHQYEGQTPVQWCGPDGVWVDVWLNVDAPPVAARVGVWRTGFREPLYAVALWREYRAMKRDQTLTRMWATRGAGQLAKCAEALALRKAFPMDLSGLYIAEEHAAEDARNGQPDGEPEPPPAQDTADAETVARLRTLVLRAHAETDGNQRRDLLTSLWHDAAAAFARDCQVLVPLGWYDGESDACTLGDLILTAGRVDTPHGETLPDEPVDAEVVEDKSSNGGCDQRSGGRWCVKDYGHDGRHQYPKADEE